MASSSSSALFSLVQYYLVNHPSITTFSWSPSQTPLSSLHFLSTTLLIHLSLVYLLSSSSSKNSQYYPLISPSTFHLLSSLHNATLLLLSLTMAISTVLSSLHTLPSPSHLFCFPPDTSIVDPPPSGPLFFWAYVYYLSKIYELLDTFLILLNPRRSKPLTFLHLYHHSLVLVMSYLWLRTRQSLMPLALLTNASVHVLMYSYYLSASLGWRWPPRWKRLVTQVQIWQFVISFAMSAVFLWMHFASGGCQGMSGWLFNAAFNASLLVLFLNFHAKAYGEDTTTKNRTEATHSGKEE